jgi:hypothetical protein
MNVGNRVIYGLWAPKMLVNFSKSRHLDVLKYIFSEKGSVVFARLSTVSMAHKKKRLRILALRPFVVSFSLSSKIPG